MISQMQRIALLAFVTFTFSIAPRHGIPAQDANPAQPRPVVAQNNQPGRKNADPVENISGRVIGADGRPAEGIVIQAHGTGPAPADGFRTTRTNAEGVYQMALPTQRAYIISVIDDRWAAPNHVGKVLYKDKPLADLDFKLSEGTIVRGTVTEGVERRPLENHQVVLWFEGGPMPAELEPAGNAPGRSKSLSSLRFTQTDAKGQYQFRVGPGNYMLVVPKVAERSAVSITTDTPQLKLAIKDEREIVQRFNLPLEVSAPLIGLVVDVAGRPVAAEQVSGRYLELPYRDSEFISAKPRGDGSFEFDRKRLPLVLVAAAPERKLVGIARVDAGQDKVIIELGPYSEARGRLLDEKGQAVAGRLIKSVFEVPSEFSTRVNYFLPAETTTAADGSFTLNRLLPGEVSAIQLQVEPGGRLTLLEIATVKPEKGKTLELGEIRWPPDQSAVTTMGQVLNADGTPAAGITVRVNFMQASMRGIRSFVQLKTSADGTFELKRPAVPTVLQVQSADQKQAGLVRIDGQQTEITLRMLRTADVRGRLVDMQGQPVADATILYSIDFRVRRGPSFGTLGGRATTASDGTYTMTGLLPREQYTVEKATILSPGYIPQDDISLAPVMVEKPETIELGDTPLPRPKYLLPNE